MTFTTFLTKVLEHPKVPTWLLDLYVGRPQFWNYALIGLIGVFINQILIHNFIKYVPLWLANFGSIFIAWLWNYFNALGYLSKFWGMKDD